MRNIATILTQPSPTQRKAKTRKDKRAGNDAVKSELRSEPVSFIITQLVVEISC